MSEGTAATNRASASGSTTVLVGLFGLQTKISRVRSVIAASIGVEIVSLVTQRAPGRRSRRRCGSAADRSRNCAIRTPLRRRRRM